MAILGDSQQRMVEHLFEKLEVWGSLVQYINSAILSSPLLQNCKVVTIDLGQTVSTTARVLGIRLSNMTIPYLNSMARCLYRNQASGHIL